MELFLFVLMLIPIVYIGEVVGLAIHCDICEYLRPARQFVWRVPFMQIDMFCEYIKLSLEKKSLQPMRSCFAIKEKHILLLCRLVNENSEV